MPYAAPDKNEWTTISLTFNNNNDNNNNNKRQTNFLINHNNINENTSSSSTSTVTTTTTATFSTILTNNNSKTFPLPSSLQDYNSKNITISSSYNASNIETTSRHKFSSSFQPEFLTASSRRKSAPEILKPLLIPQKIFQHEDDQLIIIKKKNGDIVKSSLKKKSKSEPNTPILPKYVHFNADLEQIRLFREAQEPLAVSADVTSDESEEDDDDDFVFSDDDDDDGYYRNFIDQEPELTITLPNMPLITTLHSSKPVYVDSIFLSKDKNKLQGRIMVQNIAFHKRVEVRYTFDFWQSVSEVKATYAEGVADKDKDSFDVFIFSIELFDNSRNPIDGKTMYFAVHYNVSNRDYWDNNSGSNYRVDFKKVKKLSSSSQCNHQNSKVNSNHNIINKGSLPKLSSTAIATNSSLSRKWPIIPSTPVNHLPKKSLSYDCHSPPNSATHTSIADSRKKGVAGRYDIGVSLSAAQNIPRSFSSFNNNSNVNNTNISNKNINKINNNNSATTLSSSPISSFTNTRTNYYQTPYFPTLAISCDAYKSFSSGSCYIDGMPVTTETAPLSSSSLQWEGSPKKSFGGFPLMSSNPIAIPTTKSPSSYYDHIVSQYCFSSGSPCATAVLASSPYASSPPVM